MRRWLVSFAICALLAACGLVPGSNVSVNTADSPTSGDDPVAEVTAVPTSTATTPTGPDAATTTGGPAAPLWVVVKSPDRLSQTLAYNHQQLGPLTITIAYDAVPAANDWIGVSVTAAVDSSGEKVFDWRGAGDTFDQFEFAGTPQFENYRTASVVPSPVDGLGHVFFDWGNARLPGISYLVPVPTGFDDQGTFDDPYTTGIYGATVEDPDGDGAYVISQIAEGCAPNCPLSGATITLAWNGTTYAPTEPTPATTQPPSPPETTQAPVTPPPSPTAPPTPPGPQYEFFTTPQLGPEPVRGTGCGGDGTLGDAIPDGWWYGYTYPWGSAAFEFDVVCIYYGASARPHVTECLEGPQPDSCLTYFSEDFWMVNNNDRTRTVTLSPSIEVFNPASGSCPDWDVRATGNLSLIHIVDGRVISLETRCPDGY